MKASENPLLVPMHDLAREAQAATSNGEMPAPFEMVPVDWAKLAADGVPEVEYLAEPYLPRGARAWVFGPAESAKTLYFAWNAAKLSRQGRKVVFVSQENPIGVDVARLARLGADPAHLQLFHNAGLDLLEPEHRRELFVKCAEADMVLLDTLTAIWSGDENDNAAIAAFDRDVLAPLVKMTGATVVVIHHTGHPQMFGNRKGAGAGRGASSMGQKADLVLGFEPVAEHEFTIDNPKNRPVGVHVPKARFRIIDTEDGGLDIENLGEDLHPRLEDCMAATVGMIGLSTEPLGTNALKADLRSAGFGGSTVDTALVALQAEHPRRVNCEDGRVTGKDGKLYRGRVWTLSEGQVG
jgi:hypothetical protein